jgi:hypothetical protein
MFGWIACKAHPLDDVVTVANGFAEEASSRVGKVGPSPKWERALPVVRCITASFFALPKRKGAAIPAAPRSQSHVVCDANLVLPSRSLKSTARPLRPPPIPEEAGPSSIADHGISVGPAPSGARIALGCCVSATDSPNLDNRSFFVH